MSSANINKQKQKKKTFFDKIVYFKCSLLIVRRSSLKCKVPQPVECVYYAQSTINCMRFPQWLCFSRSCVHCVCIVGAGAGAMVQLRTHGQVSCLTPQDRLMFTELVWIRNKIYLIFYRRETQIEYRWFCVHKSNNCTNDEWFPIEMTKICSSFFRFSVSQPGRKMKTNKFKWIKTTKL